MNPHILKWLRRTFGSVFFLGYIPGAPGTYGSAVVIAALWFLRNRIDNFFYPAWPLAYWLAGLGLIAVSIWLSEDAKAVFGQLDPKQNIIDECAGQFLVFFMVPLSLRTLLLGFALFRFFDVVKPFWIHRLEEIEEGVGITMDDVAAGIVSNIVLHAILGFYHVVDAWL